MKNKLLTIAASTVLIIYASFKIIQIIPKSFYRIYSPFTPFGQRLLNFLNISIYSWGLFALGLCGLVLVYADFNKDKDLYFQNRIAKIKKIVFSTYIIFSVGFIFRFVYSNYLSFQAIQTATDKGDVIEYLGISLITISIIALIFGVLNIIDRIIFGIYLLTKKGNLVKPLLIIYFTGFAYTFISRTINFVIAVISNNEIFSDASKIASLDNPQNRINSIILSFVVNILILTAGLIIVLYGIKKEKLPVKE